MVFEDRVAKYPGRWTMVKSDGSSEVVTLVRNDEPTKEGTPINAETLNTLSTVAGAINAKDEAVAAARSAALERTKAEQAATNAASDVEADLKEYSDKATTSASNAAVSEKNAKTSETNSAVYLQGTKEYFEQVRTITIGAQGWYATPEALMAAVPIGENGWWAVVGTTDTIWTWDSDTGTWKDSSQSVDVSDFLTQEQIKTLLSGYMPLRAASADVLGGVKLSDDFTADADGTLHLAGGNCPFEVGDFIHTTNSVSPAARWGGTWEEVAQDRVLMGASSTHAAGTTVEAGLPNIRFSFTAATVEQNYHGGSNYTDSAAESSTFNLYASNSNAIYGRSNTVQPAAYYVHIWHRVA